jgi:hypothetical protein
MGVLNIMFSTGGHWTPGREMHDPGACRITHGSCDSYFPNLVGKSVASVRSSLASVFSTPTDAEAFRRFGGVRAVLEGVNLPLW